VLLTPQKNGGQAEQALERSRGSFSTKIHVNVDSLGNPLRFLLTGGQRNEITQAGAVIPPLKNRQETSEYDQHLYKNGIC